MLRTIRLAVSAIAVVGLLLAPLSVSAGVMPASSGPAMSPETTTAMPDMPCCPEKAPGNCPYMAICMGVCFQNLPLAARLLVFPSLSNAFALANDPRLKSFGPEPPGPPPKA